MTSLNKKIKASYGLFSAVIFIISFFAYSDLLFLEVHIHEGEVVNDLKNEVLEIRRHEKNLLLYSDAKEVERINFFTNLALENLGTNQSVYENLIGQARLRGLLENLTRYQSFFSPEDLPDIRNSMDDIRNLGHRISQSVDNLAAEERQLLASMANRSQWALAGAIFVMALFAIAIGWRMSFAIGAPLKRLENGLLEIAKGRFNAMKPVTKDQEFVTLSKAINRMLAELDLRNRRMMQTEKLASLGVLVSGVAHELNNPLANISSSCQLLLEEEIGKNNSYVDEWLEQIDSETERAKNIVKALLDYGRKKEFKLENINVNELIEKSLLLLRNQLKRSAIVNINIPGDLVIYADLQRMQQVIINLVRNALNIEQENICIDIKATACSDHQSLWLLENINVIGQSECVFDTDRNYCEIQIADDGPGISTDYINKIFDPFFTTKEPGKGMGLGLYIVQEIVKEHEGCIGVISEENLGTTFIIRLPCVLGNEESTEYVL